MKRLFALPAFISWVLLLIATGALVFGLKEGVRGTQNAEFFPVAAFAVTLGYALGFGRWSTRHAWIVILISGLLLIFAESARLTEPLKAIIRAVPQFEMGLLRWFFQKENAEILFPDTSIFQTQFTAIAARTGAFVSRLFSGSMKQPSVREFVWDIPLLFISTWAGWGISRRDQVLFAFIPALALHAYVLYFADKDIFSLQINIFAFIVLLGIHHKGGDIFEKNESAARAARETRYTLVVLSIVIAALAGFTPSISVKDAAQRLEQNGLAKSLGLERQLPQAYVTSGLPRQHLIGSDVALSKQIIFTVKTGELQPAESAVIKEAVPRHYWRWLTYDVYNGNGWGTSPMKSISYPANIVILPINPQYRIIHQRVEKSLAGDDRLYWTGSLITVDQPFSASWRTQSGSSSLIADMLGATTEKQSYQADSLTPVISANQLRSTSRDYPKEIQKYLLLPKSVPQRVIELSRELTNDSNNPYDKAKAIETYLRAYPYSLQVPPPPKNQDIADYFLFDLKTGYCDYYATSMIVLTRAAGLPARLVVGYSNGAYDPQRAEYIIREENAHSWVEIYFTGIGWVEFEPTASQAPLTLPDELPGKKDPISKGLPTQHLSGSYTKHEGFFRQAIYTFAFTIFASISWFLYSQGFLRSHKTIRSIYQYVFYHGKKIYRNAPLHETPSIFAEKLKSKLETGNQWVSASHNEIDSLTNLYLQEIYSVHPVTKNEFESARKIWRKLFWRLLYARVGL